jgi:hypothetical protein
VVRVPSNLHLIVTGIGTYPLSLLASPASATPSCTPAGTGHIYDVAGFGELGFSI